MAIRLPVLTLALSCLLCLPWMVVGADKPVSKTIQRIQQAQGMEAATLGVVALDAEAGQVLVNYQGHLAMTPASLLKLVTTASALQQLEPEHRFVTRIAYSGTLSQGVLDGNLYLLGSGDPTLDDNLLDAVPWSSFGIQSVTGGVVADASAFDEQMVPPSWVWEDVGNYYGAGPSGLNFRQNSYRVNFASDGSGSQTRILNIEPLTPPMAFTNRVKAGPAGSGDQAYIFGAPYSYDRVVRGTIPPERDRFTIKGAIPDPAYWAAWSLDGYLRDKGIRLTQPPTTARLAGQPTPKALTELHRLQSPPLAELILETNQQSNNLFAESLLLRLAWAAEGQGARAPAIARVKEMWRSAGVNTTGWRMHDGSGLSPFNAMTPMQLAQILYQVTRWPTFEVFYQSLAVAGQSGTLRRISQDPKRQGRFVGKSGAFTGVLGYAGYLQANSGRRLIVVVLANRFDRSSAATRRDLEAVINSLMDHY